LQESVPLVQSHGNTVMRKDQERIAQWLQNRAPELGEVYKAAVRLIGDASYPGRCQLICHAARDICNRLPDLVCGLIVQDNLHKQLNTLSELWSRHKLETRELGQLSSQAPDGAEAVTREIAVPLDVFRQLDLVIKHHRQVPTIIRARATRMYEIVAPENIGRAEVTRPLTDQWMDLKRWFHGHAHAGLTDRSVDEQELQNKFGTLEAHLSKVAGEEFYEGVEVLDEILEDTNA
jgi:hypothetical protein